MRPSTRSQKLKRRPAPPARLNPLPLNNTDKTASGGKLGRLLNYAALAVAFSVAIFSIAFFARGYSPMLFADSWTVLMDYKAAGFALSLSSLLSFHNEHRPLLARIPILVDQLWGGGRGWFPFGLIFLTQAAHAGLLAWIAFKQPFFEDRQRLLVMALAIFCCFSPAQMENFIWSFQTAFVLNFFFATAAVAAVAAQKQDPSPKWIALVAVSGCGAPLCLASGVFVWWLVVLMAVTVGLPRKWVLIYMAAALLTLVLYLQGYVQQEEQNKPLDALRQPFQVVLYVVYFLASSWKWWTIRVGDLLTAAACALLAWRMIALVRRQVSSPWEAVPAAVMLFSLGTGFLAALGRLKYGIEQAGSSRYQTAALLFWFMAALLALAALPRKSDKTALAFSGFVLLAMLSIFPASNDVDRLVSERRLAWDRAGAAWISGVEDMSVMGGMIAGNQLPIREAYHDHHLGWFSVPPGSELGFVLAEDRIEARNFCQGMFHREASFLDKPWPGIRLRGSAQISSDKSEIREFLTTTSERRVVGVGSSGIAYAAVRTAEIPLFVYGVLDHGKVCPISTE